MSPVGTNQTAVHVRSRDANGVTADIAGVFIASLSTGILVQTLNRNLAEEILDSFL